MTAPIVKRNTFTLGPTDQCPRCGFGKLGLPSTIIGMGPLNYWRLGDAVGQSVAVDRVGTKPGTIVNAPILGAAGLVAGDADTAIQFTAASSQRITLPLITAVVDNWSIHAVIKPSAAGAGSRTIFYNGNGALNGWGCYQSAAGKLIAFAENSGALTTGSGAVLSSVAPSHIDVIRRAGRTYQYINGILDETGTTALPVTPTVGSYIGAEQASLYFDGSVKDVAVWDRALAPEEVAKLYFAGGLTLQHLLSSHDESNARQCRDCACVTQDTAI